MPRVLFVSDNGRSHCIASIVVYTTLLASSKERKNILTLFLSFFLLAAKTVAIIVKSNAVMIDVTIRVVCLSGSSRIATQH